MAPSVPHARPRLAGRAPLALRLAPALAFLVGLVACGAGPRGAGEGAESGTTIVFRHFQLFGGERPLTDLIGEFERENPGIGVRDVVLPSSSDQQHQFYVTQLEGGAADFDVFALDVVWVPELARAGWLRPVPESSRAELASALAAPALAACTQGGSLQAVPWFVDVGLLYCRSDLLRAAGLEPPRTWGELAADAHAVLARERAAGDTDLEGFVWEGRQYEGLVCCALEALHARGARVLEGGACALGSEEALAGARFLRELVTSGVSPAAVTAMDEEPARRAFEAGRAVFLRNWPYAMRLLEEEGSPVRGKVVAVPVPGFAGGSGAPMLGGWCLGIRRGAAHPEACERLVRFLVSEPSQLRLATAAGLLPSRRSTYDEPELRRDQPFLASLRGSVELAVPRPVTPFYPMISRVLQSELSAIVTGLRTPEQALGRACVQIDHVLSLEDER